MDCKKDSLSKVKGGPKAKDKGKPKLKMGGAGAEVVQMSPVISQGVSQGADAIVWKKTGVAGNCLLKLYLKKDQQIVADKHAMVYADGALKFESNMGGLKKAFGRMFSGESAFMSYITGTGSASGSGQQLVLGTAVPGDILCINLAANEQWKLSQGAFLAGTKNIDLSGKLGFRGIFQGEGLVLSTATAKDGPGTLWICGYGLIERQVVPAGQTLLVDNEHFMASDVALRYELTTVGDTKSLFFGGEGIAMKFTGPCTVYTQSHGLSAFAKDIAPYIKPYIQNSRS